MIIPYVRVEFCTNIFVPNYIIPYNYQFVPKFGNNMVQIDNYTVLEWYGKVMVLKIITESILYYTEILELP